MIGNAPTAVEIVSDPVCRDGRSGVEIGERGLLGRVLRCGRTAGVRRHVEDFLHLDGVLIASSVIGARRRPQRFVAFPVVGQLFGY